MVFRIGQVTRKVVFTDGCKMENKRAIFKTNDNLTQILIEKSPEFNKSIKLDKTIPEPGDTVTTTKADKKGKEEPQDKNKASNGKSYPKVTTVNEVVDILVKQGVSQETLTSQDLIMAKAEELKLKFPNLKL